MQRGLFVWLTVLGLSIFHPALADLRKGFEAYKRGDYAAAVTELKPPAEAGDREAQYLLGLVYGLGSKVVPRNPEQAVLWFRRAADQGESAAQDALGQAYANGQGVKKSAAEAVKWFRLSAAQGDPAGEFSLGFAYLRGDGVAADAKEAVAWLQKSAAQDFPSAEVMLGEIYLAGKVVQADEKLALQWFHKAANHGEPFAEASLGLMYAAGRGARHDKVQAYKWLTLALHELPRGKFRDAVTKAHDTVAGKLTSAQHERAEQQIAKFEPAPVGGKHGGVRGRTAPLNEPEPAGPIGTGSGFVVSAKGHIVTNDHVVAKCGQMRVRHLGADSMAAKVVVRDSANDLAVIQIAQAPAAIAVLRSGTEIRPGDGVVAIGFPLAGLLAEDANVTTGGVSALAGLRNDQRYLQISAPVQPGNSGGPLLDFGGNVVGVVSAKLNAGAVAKAIGDIPQNINFAIKISLVRQFLDANHIAYRTGAFGTRIEAADVGERAKTFTALVECWK